MIYVIDHPLSPDLLESASFSNGPVDWLVGIGGYENSLKRIASHPPKFFS